MSRPSRRVHLWALLVTLILVGTGSPGVAQAGEPGTVPGEGMALPAGAGEVVADPAADGGAHLLVWAPATATGTVSTTMATSTLTLRARGDLCQGAPVAELLVDGRSIGRVTVSSPSFQNFQIAGSWPAGAHSVGVRYENDLVTPECDRNLRVDTVSLSGGATAFEAESMTFSSTVGMSAADRTASAGRHLLIWSTATATRPVDLINPASRVVVRARGDQCQGAPMMAVTIDGTTVGSVAVPSTGWVDHAFSTTAWPVGRHTVGVRFTNDFRTSGCDRNLKVDTITLAPAEPQVEARPTTFGMSTGEGPNRGLDSALATAAGLGQKLDRYNFYMAWEFREAFPTPVLAAAAAAGVHPSITWEPWNPAAGVDQPKYRLSAIAGGAFDSYIDEWARAAAAFGRPMTVRFAHEMNGSWYPWGASVNGNTPAQYVAAFRHVHDRFRAAGAHNVQWSWSPNIVTGMQTPLSQVYPGDSYVDAIGIDGYNWGIDLPNTGGWRTPQQVFGATLTEIAVIAPTRPVYVAETGSSENGGSKSAWINELFTYLDTTSVRGVDWFHFGGTPDWRLTSSPAATEAARAALSTW